MPPRRFSHIHVDLVGPLPASEGFTHLFNVIDRTTCWAEVVPLRSTAAADCAHVLFRGWIARFGVPAAITSDRGSQFTSALWAALCGLLNIQHVQTTAYHPEGNGLVERFHRRLKDALRARCASPRWLEHLPWVMLGLRAAAREDSGVSLAQSVFGSELALPSELAANSELFVSQFLTKMQGVLNNPSLFVTGTRHNTAEGRTAPAELPAALLTAPYVLVRRDGHVPPLELLSDGPYAVLRRCQLPPHTPGTSYRWGARHAWSAGSPAPCQGRVGRLYTIMGSAFMLSTFPSCFKLSTVMGSAFSGLLSQLPAL